MLVDQVEGIPAEKDGLVKRLCLSVCSESLVHKVSYVKLDSWRESFLLHKRTTIASEGKLLSTDSFKFVHYF